jgi:hypothetical protein
MVPNPINNRSRDSVDKLAGEDWIVIAGIKFRQTAHESRFFAPFLAVFVQPLIKRR